MKISLFPTKESFEGETNTSETATIEPAVTAEINSGLQQDLIEKKNELMETKTDAAMTQVSELQEDMSDVDALVKEVKDNPKNEYAAEQLSRKLVSVAKKWGIGVPASYGCFAKECYPVISIARRRHGLEEAQAFIDKLQTGVDNGMSLLPQLFKEVFTLAYENINHSEGLIEDAIRNVMKSKQYVDKDENPSQFYNRLSQNISRVRVIHEDTSHSEYKRIWSLNSQGSNIFTLPAFTERTVSILQGMLNDCRLHYKTTVLEKDNDEESSPTELNDWWQDLSQSLADLGLSSISTTGAVINPSDYYAVLNQGRESDTTGDLDVNFTLDETSFNVEHLNQLNALLVGFRGELETMSRLWTDEYSVKLTLLNKGMFDKDYVQAVLSLLSIYNVVLLDVCSTIHLLSNKQIEIASLNT